MVGEQISKYRVIGPAVAWPLADVHTGQDPRTDQVVDIILLPPDAAASAGVADQFLTEMRAVLAFRHPGFVRLLDCGRLNDGAIYLVSEHVEAECLSERLKRDAGLASDLATVCEVVGQTAVALEAAHAAGLLYLCLRPEHMLLVPASQAGLPVTVRLLELGLGNYFMSRILKMTPGKELPASMLRYASPEQCRGSGVDPRSDIYALGCVLFELLVGQPPFRETALWDLVAAHAHEVPPRIRDFHPELPSGLDDLVATMLEKDPAQRPFCMSEISAVLRAAVSKPAVVLEPARDQSPAPILKTVILGPGLPVPEPAAILASAPVPPPAPMPKTVFLEPGPPIPEPATIPEPAPAQPAAPIAKTVMLDTGPPVPEPAHDSPSAPAFRPTRVLSSAEEVLVPRRPSASSSPRRARREPSPASDDTAPVRSRPRPPRGKRATVRVQRSSHAGLFVGVMLACIALGVGLFLWLLRPTAIEAKRTPLEDTPAREQQILPPVVPSPAPAAINTPPPATRRLAAELAEPKAVPTDKNLSTMAKNRVSGRRPRLHDSASPRSPRSRAVKWTTFPF